MTCREITAAILFALGFLLILGAVGQAEYSYIWADEFNVRAGIGIALMAAALPVSGDIELPKKKNRRR